MEDPALLITAVPGSFDRLLNLDSDDRPQKRRAYDHPITDGHSISPV